MRKEKWNQSMLGASHHHIKKYCHRTRNHISPFFYMFFVFSIFLLNCLCISMNAWKPLVCYDFESFFRLLGFRFRDFTICFCCLFLDFFVCGLRLRDKFRRELLLFIFFILFGLKKFGKYGLGFWNHFHGVPRGREWLER